MTERIVRPVRAWADYDEWSGYLEYRHQWLDQWLEWTLAEIPKGAVGELYSDTNEVYGIVEAVQAWSGERGFGPLRSLRVLYGNGYELDLEWMFSDEPGFWFWKLRDAQAEQASGDFREDKDSEAVERAMIAAAAWFSQRQEAAE